MIKYLTLFLLIFFSAICAGQSMFSPNIVFQDDKNFISEVKQLDQFVKRFNNEEDILTGNEKSKKEIVKEKENIIEFQEYRKRLLSSLLNHKDSNLLNKLTIDFINFTCDEANHIFIRYSDDNWFATINCKIIYKEKPKNLILTLRIDGDYKIGFKWVLVGANADFLNIEATRKDTTKFIGPMNHELGFMDLLKVFDDSKNMPEYTSKQFMPDGLSILLFLVKTKEIKYLKVDSIRYHFLQIENWIFTVDYFNRYEINSGWLISSIIKTNDTDKLRYKKTVLSIR
jgi:hypothetical protein